jgi:hypothetical protein
MPPPLIVCWMFIHQFHLWCCKYCSARNLRSRSYDPDHRPNKVKYPPGPWRKNKDLATPSPRWGYVQAGMFVNTDTIQIKHPYKPATSYGTNRWTACCLLLSFQCLLYILYTYICFLFSCSFSLFYHPDRHCGPWPWKINPPLDWGRGP